MRRGFSLLELAVVLAIVGLTVGLVAPSLGRGIEAERERRQLVELVGVLGAERVEAMRGLRALEVSLDYRDKEMTAARRLGGDAEVAGRWGAWRAAPLAGGPSWGERVVFEASGRASVRELRFVSSARAGRIWLVEFDPISGAAALRAVTEDAR